MRIVIDTNVLVAAVSRKSPYRHIFDQLLLRRFGLYVSVSTDILLEYSELLERFYSKVVADLTVSGIMLLENVFKVETYYNLRLISEDADDNKFVDCTFTSNAHYLVTNDRHYNVLKSVDFPKINPLKADEFLEVLAAT